MDYIIAALGNPGPKYEYTRHNAGWLCMDVLCNALGCRLDKGKWNALVGNAVIANRRVLLMKPLTYMNESGIAVRAAADFYGILPENILVLCDDVNFDVGQMRARRSGSDGGQKGVRSVIQHLGTNAFPRIKIGVGKKPHPDYEMIDWVLSRFSDSELASLRSDILPRAVQAVPLIVEGRMEEALEIVNRRGAA
ncbi:MAG: aminoacyl-tRNA hydrolase [Oscillospiraceae bacterium]|jgi:PTH1 family peptidyl-tRNA hydrolase|nr:aminoacyl-tRNA hydrolase [Oscillospiraceae bacterium]